jgi:peptide/nickel transport system permease protein
MKAISRGLKDLFKYPSAVAGLFMVLVLIAISIFTMIRFPYNEAINLWRGGEEQWFRNPKYAMPSWINFFRTKKLASTIDVDTIAHPEYKVVELNSDGTSSINFELPFEYTFDSFPSDLVLYFSSTYANKAPFISVVWVTPDGREIRLKNLGITQRGSYRISQDDKLLIKLKGALPHVGLLSDPAIETPTPLKGKYTIKVEALTFEKNSDVNMEFIAYGQVSGIAGTDHLRRDLIVALLWGTPIALAFGLLAAVGTTLASMIIAATGAWFGGWVDTLIQRITEVNMVLPFLPILIMVGTFYSRSLWVILGTVIVLSIFGATVKTFRAVFLQTKESPYIEAAKAYGASNGRIIFSYLIPRIIPMLIPQFIVLIPSYVFLEASLAVLGLGDPILPTWGKIIDDARANGAMFQGWYYWVLEPSFLLLFTGLAFSMLGFALDRVFNPRLRTQ